MGRSYAIELARRGARVVVNDYGGTTGGLAGSLERAKAVVREVAALGGVALPTAQPSAHPKPRAPWSIRQSMRSAGWTSSSTMPEL
jgi:hypothetical protein